MFSVVSGQEQESNELPMQLKLLGAGLDNSCSPEGSCEFSKDSLSRAARGM